MGHTQVTAVVVESAFKLIEVSLTSSFGEKEADHIHSFVNVDNPGRRLAADDPEPHDLLPVDDTAWDEGVRLITSK